MPVPVYMGSDKVDELLGGNLKTSIIKVKEFETPKKLANYLMFVSKNKTLKLHHLTKILGEDIDTQHLYLQSDPNVQIVEVSCDL